MKKLKFDLGFKDYEIGNGVLRFNPNDLGVYSRFSEAGNRLAEVEKDMVAKAKNLGPEDKGEAVLKLLADADREIKKILVWIFGEHNDFDAIFGGVNVMSIGSNGERIITNFIHAIQPVLEEGAKQCADQQVAGAVSKAQMNRAQRRAAGIK